MDATFGGSANYRGVDLEVALRGPLYSRSVNNVIKSLLWSHELRPASTSCDIAIVYSYLRSERADYRELIDNLVSYLENQAAEVFFLTPAFSIKDRARVFGHLVRSLPRMGRIRGGFFDRLVLTCMIARSMATVDLIFDFLNSSNFRVLVTFCDAHEIDNIVAQCARLRGITTVTLQHGQYHVSAYDIPENLALRNLVSDYLCAWGQATVDEAAKAGNTTTTICKTGSLKGYAEDRCFYEPTDFAVTDNSQKFCVMLNADNCYSSNCALIKLANEYCDSYGSSFSVRYHPRNKREKYEKLYRNDCYHEYKEDDAGRIGFYLVYTSGVFAELLAQRALFFIYVDEESPDLFHMEELSIRSSEMLANRINWIRSAPARACATYNAISAYVLEPGNARIGYDAFFKMLLDKE